jgi:hypothetical protein
VLAEVHDALAHDGGQRQREECAREAIEPAPHQEREDDQQRIDPQRLREDGRRHDVALDLLQRGEHDGQPDRVERVVAEQRDQHRRRTPDRRADVRDQLGDAVERSEHERVRLPVREDPERAHDPERDARAGPHDQREEQLPPDVAEDRALDTCRVVVLGRAVPARHHGAHDRADALPVEQHVDRQDDDQDEGDRALDQSGQRLAREGNELTRSFGHAGAERLECSLALLGELDVDALVVEPLLQVGERGVRVVDDPRDGVGELRRLVADRLGKHRDDTADDEDQREEDAQHGHAARKASALEHHHERVQQQRDERGHDEDQGDRAGRPEQQVGA